MSRLRIRSAGPPAVISRSSEAGALTETPHVQSFDEADESRDLEHGRVDLIRLGGISFDRATFEPGWRFTEHAGQSGSCQERHLGYPNSGTDPLPMDDGRQIDAAAGDVYLHSTGA